MTRADSAPGERSDAAGERSDLVDSRWARLLCGAPELLASALAGFALPTMLLLLTGHLVWAYALPLGLVCAIVAAVLCGGDRQPITREDVGCSLTAVALLLAWTIFNACYSAQDLFAHRDPTTYDVAGRWLVDHQSLHIPTHPELFGLPHGYIDTSAGFYDTGHGTLTAQGNHLLPVLLGATGRIFGDFGLLKANVVIGALALFALFGVARRVVGSRFALLVTAALAVSMPMIYVSRDTFTEPLALLLLMASLILLQRAIAGGRLLDYGLSGFVASTSAMVRIDAYVALLALIVVAAAILARAAPSDRGVTARRVGLLLFSALVPTVIGWVDVSYLSPAYYTDQRRSILHLGDAAVLLLVLGAALVLLVWRPSVLRWLDTRRNTLAQVVCGLLVLAFVVLASRPLWLKSRGSVVVPYLETVQRNAHVAVDGTRLYNEQTLNWQALYFGWPTVILAVAGYAVLIRRFVVRRESALVGVLTMALSMSALYLWTSQITPDQIWASRRYIPLVMPMLVLAAAAALQYARQRYGSRLASIVTTLLAVVVVAYPLGVTVPDSTIREEAPQLRQVEAVCHAVGSKGAILALDSTTQYGYSQTLRSYCDVPVLAVPGAKPAQLAEMRATLLSHGRTLYALASASTTVAVAPGMPAPSAFSTAVTTRWRSTLNSAPTSASHETVSILLGSIDAEGYFTALHR